MNVTSSTTIDLWSSSIPYWYSSHTVLETRDTLGIVSTAAVRFILATAWSRSHLTGRRRPLQKSTHSAVSARRNAGTLARRVDAPTVVRSTSACSGVGAAPVPPTGSLRSPKSHALYPTPTPNHALRVTPVLSEQIAPPLLREYGHPLAGDDCGSRRDPHAVAQSRGGRGSNGHFTIHRCGTED